MGVLLPWQHNAAHNPATPASAPTTNIAHGAPLPHHRAQLLSEIQRTWAYLESLFIGSEEVKRELPDATQRFARIDADIKGVLRVGG